MNIDDVKDVEAVYDHEVIPAIFEKQEALMAKYEPLEAKNGAIVPHRPWKIDDKFVQMRLKDMFWRFTEEICEAIEFDEDLVLYNWKERWDNDHTLRHFFEEMVDALHFLTEASIIANLDQDIIVQTYDNLVVKMGQVEDAKRINLMTDDLRARCMLIIKLIGLAANCLKNKPWKNTHMGTDEDKFRDLLYGTWREYLLLMANLGMGPKDLYILYVKKNEVNQFRQRSNY